MTEKTAPPAAAPASPPPASLSIQAAQLGIRSPLTAEPAPASPPGDLGADAEHFREEYVRAYDKAVELAARAEAAEAEVSRLRAEAEHWKARADTDEASRLEFERDAQRLRAERDAALAFEARVRAAAVRGDIGGVLNACGDLSNERRTLIPGAGAARSPGSGGA